MIFDSYTSLLFSTVLGFPTFQIHKHNC